MWSLLVAMAAAAPMLVSVEESAAPSGVLVTWSGSDCGVGLRVDNSTAAPVVLDWSRSTFTPTGLATVGIVPGAQSAQSAMLGMPPSVVPPGGFVVETVFRRDRLPSNGTGCAVGSPGETATVMLAIDSAWATSRLRFEVDEAAELARVAEAKAKAEKAACVARVMDLSASADRHRVGAVLVGAGTAILTAGFGAVAIDAGQHRGDVAAPLTAAVLTAGAGGGLTWLIARPITRWESEAATGCQ